MIETGLSRMKDSGLLKPNAETKALAVAVLAAIQGSILLSKTARNSQPLDLAFEMAFNYIERYAV